MSDAAQGVYIRLLCYMWNDSRDQHSIENNDKIIAKLLGISLRKWKKYRAEIQWKDDPILIENDGFLYSKRLQKEKEKQLIKSEKAKKSAEKRWMRPQSERIDQASNSHNFQQCTSSSTSSSNIKPFVEGSTELRLATLLFTKIQNRKSDFKKPNLQQWAKHIDLMIRIDARIPENIKNVILWCQQDEFWQNNILSTAKLRKQFDQLDLKMQQDKKQERPTQFFIEDKNPPCVKCGRESVAEYDKMGHLCRNCWPKGDMKKALELVNQYTGFLKRM